MNVEEKAHLEVLQERYDLHHKVEIEDEKARDLLLLAANDPKFADAVAKKRIEVQTSVDEALVLEGFDGSSMLLMMLRNEYAKEV